MTKSEVSKNLISFQDLKNRWGYGTIQGVRRRAHFDPKFPEPILVVGNGAKVFWLPDILNYEKLRGNIDLNVKRYEFYVSKEEWDSYSEEEKDKRRNSIWK